MKVIKSLKGYRIGLLREYQYHSQSLTRSGALILSIFNHAPTEYEAFKAWWNDQMQDARDEKVTLVVMENIRGSNDNVYRNLLKRIEEEEFDSGVENGVRITTYFSLQSTVSTGKLPVDSWDDSIERGESAYIFHGDLFAIANSAEGNDIERTKHEISINGGVLLNEETLTRMKGENIAPRICYVVFDGTQLQTLNSLLAKIEDVGLRAVVVCSIWLRACDKTDAKCLTIRLREISGMEMHFVVKVTSRISKVFEAYVSSRDELSLPQCQFLLDGKEIDDHGATILALGLKHDSVIDVLLNGEQLSFPSEIKIGLRDTAGRHTWFLLKVTSRISKVFDAYASRESISLSQCQFLLDGKEIDNHNATLLALGLKHNSIIDVLLNGEQLSFPSVITIGLRDTAGRHTWFLLKVTSRISKVFEAYASRERISLSQYDFRLHDGTKIDDDDDTTLKMLELENGDIIDVLPKDHSE